MFNWIISSLIFNTKKRGKLQMKRAQSAMEFLMTYGWAFVVVLITLGVISYAGVFDISQLVEEKCDFLSGIICVDSLANNTGVSLALQNGLPVSITGIQIYIDSCGPAFGSSTLGSGVLGNYTAVCALNSGIFRSIIHVNYTNPDSNFNHTKTGTLVYRVR